MFKRFFWLIFIPFFATTTASEANMLLPDRSSEKKTDEKYCSLNVGISPSLEEELNRKQRNLEELYDLKASQPKIIWQKDRELLDRMIKKALEDQQRLIDAYTPNISQCVQDRHSDRMALRLLVINFALQGRGAVTLDQLDSEYYKTSSIEFSAAVETQIGQFKTVCSIPLGNMIRKCRNQLIDYMRGKGENFRERIASGARAIFF